MEIFEYDNFSFDNTGDIDADTIVSDGISLRIGNRVVSFKVDKEETLPVDDLKKDFDVALNRRKTELEKEVEEYKDTLRSAFNVKKDELDQEKQKYKELSNQTQTLPNITATHIVTGLSVCNGSDNGSIIWYFDCVYAPKFVNNRRIDPSFAKRLMTPICIEIRTDSDKKVINIRILKIIGKSKFRHYHSLSASSDCWGDFRFSGDDASTPEQAITLANKALVVLETINEFSLGTRNPRGLSRFDTIKKHLLDADENIDAPTGRSNTRNTRTGFDATVNDDLNDSVWTTI